jgi:KipI family sensor histidine kinase inhibitor
MSVWPRVLPVGDRAVAVELGDAIDPALSARVRALEASLSRQPLPGLLEAVPTYRSLLVLYEPAATGFAALATGLLERAAGARAAPQTGRLHEIATLYGGEEGPDLPEVARRYGLSESEVVALHASTEYTAFMLGFRPGFPYLGLLPEILALPRRSTPRVRVPPGSVAIAGRQTAIYPSASPGGWHLIGRTSLRLFDPGAELPALIAPGDRVRFVPVRELPPAEARASDVHPALHPALHPAVEVVDPGLLTTIQARGRTGHRRFGVPAAGPLDLPAHATANRIVGNPADAATLECTVAGPRLRFLGPAHFAITGADLRPVLHRADLGDWPVPLGVAVRARPGNLLALMGRGAGARAYLAFAGGIEAPFVLGSRATDVAAGFGGFEGRALRAGDTLGLGGSPAPGHHPEIVGPPPASRVVVRVVLGPQDDHFDEDALQRFLEQAWRVGSTSDRIGCRLEGPPLAHRGPSEIVSDGLVPGAIQVPPDGAPIVVMADGPTTGGYPKIATVVSADLPLVGQLVPGEGEVRFTAVSVDEAHG